MTFAGLVRRNLGYYWRGNLAVALGVALGAAVLTGALLVGDSLRGSLLDLSLRQLGWVDGLLAPGQLFREQLASEIPGVPVVLLSATASPDRDPNRVVNLQLFGVTNDFFEGGVFTNDEADDAVIALAAPVASALGVNDGDRLWLNVPKSEAVPRETLLGRRKSDETLEAIAVRVKAILPQGGMADFALRPSPTPPLNGFVPLPFLQGRLNLGDKINVVLIQGKVPDNVLDGKLKLADWGLTLTTPADRAKTLVRFLDPSNTTGELRTLRWKGRVPDDLAKQARDGVLSIETIETYYREHRPYLLIQSDNLSIRPKMESAIERALMAWPRLRSRPSLIYLADRMSVGGQETPYATIAAVRPDDVPEVAESLRPGEIRIAPWPDSPLKPKVGDEVKIEYYMPAAGNRLSLKSATFRYAGPVPLAGAADDPDWTPSYPGLTDKLDIGSWENPPFPPYSTKKVMERIDPADEAYWKRYRATPKAYITLADGQNHFATRFGKLTSIRLDLQPGVDAEAAAADFTKRLLAELKPAEGGFVVQDVRAQAIAASAGSNDFGGLFLGFSFFLILSALVLVGLLVRLNLERRSSEIGLLAATGWSPRRIGWLLRAEGSLIVVAGAALGLLGAHWFAGAMLRLLEVNWPGQGSLRFLHLHETPLSYAIGFVAAVLVSLLTLAWAFRVMRRATPRRMLAGELSADATSQTPVGRRGRSVAVSTIVLAMSIVGVVGLLTASRFVDDHMALAVTFLMSGFCALAALLTLAWKWLTAQKGPGDPQPTIVRLGIRNAGRNPVRSLLTIGLLASATFMIVAVEAFHREPATNFFAPHGGSGGFRLLAETEVPLFQNLADPAVQAELGINPDARAAISAVESFRVEPGDDASCLNLYKPVEPRILGVPASLVQRDRFAFADSLEPVDNPWTLLERTFEDGSVPAIVDANSAQWILKVKLGDTIAAKDADDRDVKLRVVALLKESLFQSEVLVSEASFLKLFPTREGYRLFLIETIASSEPAVRVALAKALATQGVLVQSTFDRVASYLAVENTYLATFQALGALGLALGALGLAIVLVRGVWERRAELALLRALGLTGRQIAGMVLAENAILLLTGLGVGIAAALVAVAPHLGTDARPLAGSIAGLLAVVAGVGLAAGLAAVLMSLRTPVLTALRRE